MKFVLEQSGTPGKWCMPSSSAGCAGWWEGQQLSYCCHCCNYINSRANKNTENDGRFSSALQVCVCVVYFWCVASTVVVTQWWPSRHTVAVLCAQCSCSWLCGDTRFESRHKPHALFLNNEIVEILQRGHKCCARVICINLLVWGVIRDVDLTHTDTAQRRNGLCLFWKVSSDISVPRSSNAIANKLRWEQNLPSAHDLLGWCSKRITEGEGGHKLCMSEMLLLLLLLCILRNC